MRQAIKFLKARKGGITVFQCIIFTGLLFLSGVLIDAARIILAEKELQSAVNTAARSVLAGYDGDLSGDYGLFGLDTASDERAVKNEFIKYLKANLQTGTHGFRLIRYDVDYSKTSACGYRNLLVNEDNAFREQILKYMKYRAPINISQNVVEKLSASGIFKKKDFAVKEKTVREKRGETKADVDRLNKKIKNANANVSETFKFAVDESNTKEYAEKLNLLKAEYADADNIINSAVRNLYGYGKAAEESKSYAEAVNREEKLSNDAKINIYEKEFGKAEDSVNDMKAKINKSMKEVEEHIKTVAPLLGEIESLSAEIKVLESQNSLLADDISENEEAGSDGIKKQLDENSWRIAGLRTLMSGKLEQVNSMKSSLKTEVLPEIKLDEAQNMPEEAPGQTGKENKTKLEELQKQLDKLLGNRRIDRSWIINGDEFSRAVSRDAEKYGEISDMEVKLSENDIDYAEKENDGIFAFMDKVKTAVENSAQNLYIVEYIMDRYTYHASLTERNHYFQKGEVEYILWGGSSQNSNIAATISSIGFLRFAVNSIDYFATSKVPHPVFRLVYALGRGIVQSSIDCYRLYRGESIDICPSLGKSELKLSYADHLRIFLLMQAAADGKGQLNNMRQLIQVNINNPDSRLKLQRPDFKLSNCNTMLEAKATVKVNLWFLPLLQPDKLKIPSFDGGSYVISKEIHLGY